MLTKLVQPAVMHRSSRFSRLHYIVFSLLPLLFLCVCAEVAIRAYDWSRGVDSRARASWYWGFDQDRLLGYRSRPNLDMVQGRPHSRLDTNAEGFRDFDLPLHASAPRRLIICMGESSTWGIGSSSRLTTWPHQLHQILTQQDGQFVVFNAGMPGYTIVENLQLLNLRLLKYRPEAVVYMGFRNDVVFYMRALSESTDLNFYPRRLAPIPATAINNLFMRSSLIAAVVSRVGAIVPLDKQNAPGEAEGTDLTERGKQTFLDQIALMKDLCDRHNVKLLWIDQPINYATGSAGPGYRAAAESARSLLHDELAKERIPLLQARTLYDYRQQPMIDDAHFTDAGNRRLASLLAPQIVAELNQPKP